MHMPFENSWSCIALKRSAERFALCMCICIYPLKLIFFEWQKALRLKSITVQKDCEIGKGDVLQLVQYILISSVDSRKLATANRRIIVVAYFAVTVEINCNFTLCHSFAEGDSTCSHVSRIIVRVNHKSLFYSLILIQFVDLELLTYPTRYKSS